MKRRGMKKGMVLMMAGMMAAMSMAGCGSSGQTETTAQTTAAEGTASTTNQGSDTVTEPVTLTYPLADGGEITYGMVLGSWKTRHDSFTEVPFGIALEEKTGMKMNMVHVENNDAMNLLIASGDLPDIICFNFATKYTGGEQKAISDGVIYPMSEEFVKENAPDYWEVINSNPEILKQVKTPEGDIWGFAFILGDEILKSSFGVIIRDDWCEQLGMELPETAEEFYTMLKGFKEQLGVEIPLSVDVSTLNSMMENGSITSPFGLVTRDVYVKDGKVEIGYAQPEYKAVLEWLNKLYAEGLLDPNFSTVDSKTVAANMLTGVAGASAGTCGSKMGSWLSSNKDVPDYSLAGIKSLTANRGETPMYGSYSSEVVGTAQVITTSCDDPAAAAKFFNYGYTEEGHMLYNFGIEGVSYEMVDNKPVFTDTIMNNPDGLSVSQALSEYEMAYTNGPFVQDRDYLLQYYATDAQKEALTRWSDTDAAAYKLPKITISLDVSNEYSALVSELQTYRDEMTIKFIRGEESIDKFDAYMSTLESMGINRLQEIYQSAYDEYQSR